MLDRTSTLFSHVKGTDNPYATGGLRDFFLYRDLGIAEATVKVHMTALMRKLNVRNRTQAAIMAESLGLD